MARYDDVGLDLLPGCPASDTLAMLDIVFPTLVKRRFGVGLDRREVQILASSVSVLSKHEVSAESVSDVVNHQIDGVEESSLSIDVQNLVRFFIFAKLVDDLGIYDDELESFLVESETVARDHGHALAEMPMS